VRRIVAVFAHPDDETILAGGTLAGAAAAGDAVTVVCASADDGRDAELRAACEVLGLRDPLVLGLPDGELDERQDELRVGVRAALDEFGADVVITFGQEGLYWHADHVAVHEAVVAATDGAALAFATMPEGHIEALVEELRARGRGADLWGLDPSAFGAPPGDIAARRDVRAHLDEKLRALAEHRSQLPPGHALRDLPRDLAERYLGYEFFVGAAP
jgi:N-acetyl-1-D-myo-inositol-2-amino-2-deoxy-alpha-D-glucopyranoside deacetylase